MRMSITSAIMVLVVCLGFAGAVPAAEAEESDPKESDVIRCYYMLPTVHVFPDKPVEYALNADCEKPIILAAKGEVEPIQLVVEPTGESLEHVRVEVGNLSDGTNALPGSAVEVRVVGYAYYKYYDKTWPDPLFEQPRDGVPLAKGKRQAWWLTVAVPENQPAGIYRGLVKVSSDSTILRTVPFVIEVSNFPLVKEQCLSMNIGLGVFGEPYEELAFKRHFNDFYHASGVFWPEYRIDSTGNVTVDFEKYDRRISDLRDKWGLRPVIVGFILGDARGGGYIEGTFNPEMIDDKGQKVKVCIDPRKGPAEKARFEAVLKQFQEHLREKGWLEDAAVYLWDEPATAESQKKLKEISPYFKAAAPELDLLLTATPNPKVWPTEIDVYCCLVNHLNDELQKWCQENGKRFWIYSCGARQSVSLTVDKPALHARAFGWLAYRFRAESTLYWAIHVGYNKVELLSDGLTFSTDGRDGVLFYPNPNAADRPLPCIRSENIRDGLEDAGILMLAEKKAGPQISEQVHKLMPNLKHDPNPVKYMQLRKSAYKVMEYK